MLYVLRVLVGLVVILLLSFRRLSFFSIAFLLLFLSSEFWSISAAFCKADLLCYSFRPMLMPTPSRRNNVLSTKPSKNGKPRLLTFSLSLRMHKRKQEAILLNFSDVKLNMKNLKIQLRLWEEKIRTLLVSQILNILELC